jgi:anaerobic nitric oxide reductase transcription regulator
MLTSHFADIARRQLGAGRVQLTPEAQSMLFAADWPGNVRELENVVSRAALRASFGLPPGQPVRIDASHLNVTAGAVAALPPAGASPASASPAVPFREQVEEFERRLIRESLERHGGRWAAVARELGLHRSNLHHLARRLGLIAE